MTDRPQKKPSPLLKACVGMQLLHVLIFLFVPFGFDKPSSWGLDFGHFLLTAGLYFLFLIAGIVFACIKKRWLWIPIQLLPIVIFAAYSMIMLFWVVEPVSPHLHHPG